jgi:hypothetical protein
VSYRPDMSRAVMIFSGVLAAGLTGFGGAAVAHAGPPAPCSYTLSPPEVVQVDGATMVTATVTPTDCAFPGSPRQSVACLQRQDGQSVVECTQGRGENASQVYAPYSPGTYVSTGRGCGAWAGINEPAPDCQLLGPVTATL